MTMQSESFFRDVRANFKKSLWTIVGTWVAVVVTILALGGALHLSIFASGITSHAERVSNPIVSAKKPKNDLLCVKSTIPALVDYGTSGIAKRGLQLPDGRWVSVVAAYERGTHSCDPDHDPIEVVFISKPN